MYKEIGYKNKSSCTLVDAKRKNFIVNMQALDLLKFKCFILRHTYTQFLMVWYSSISFNKSYVTIKDQGRTE